MERLLGIMPKVLNDLSTDDGIHGSIALAAWPHCAGELIAARTKAIEYFEERLIVAIQDATWQAHLEDLSATLVAKLNAAIGQGSVRFIEFRVQPEAFERRTERKTDSFAVEPPQPVIAAAAAIADEKLRRRFLEAAGAYLDNQKELETRNSKL